MKHNISIVLMASFAIAISGQTMAQKGKKDPKDNPDYTHYFKDVEQAIETKEIAIEFSNGVSRRDFLKFKAKFTNNTNDFLIVDPSKFLLEVDGKKLSPKEKAFILDPNDKNSKTIDIKEGANFVVDRFEVVPKGFARIPIEGSSAVPMPEFQLPAATNVISSGNFEVNLRQLKQETQETWARFEITYKGDGYGILDPSRISVKTQSGQQFANDMRKSKNILLEKGESKKVDVTFHIPAHIVDMQFATLMVQWGEAMVETKAVYFDVDDSSTFELDEKITGEKNK